jgi:hypothetical protein
VLHPVGPLSTAVYWRRRLLVLGGTLGVLAGGGWLGVAAVGGDHSPGTVVAGAADAAPAPTPALEQVLPSLAAVQVPTAAPSTAAAPTAATTPTTAAPAAGPVPGGPCTDDMIAVVVRPDPPSTPVGSKPTFHLVITNVSTVACVRTLDKGLQEIVLVDGAGNRLWGSNDCFPEASSDVRTLQPGESADFPVLWSGLTSTTGCVGGRSTPGAGSYVLRGRLETRTSPDAALTLT